MALNQLGLGFVFTAQDLASGVIGRVKGAFMSMEDRTESATRAFQSNFAQFGRGIAVLGAGLATLSGVFSLAETAGKFELALAGVAAVSGATAEELNHLHDAAIEAGIATQYSPTQAVEGLRELAQAGFNAKESIALLIPTLDLAAGSLGELTPQSAAGLVAQTMKAFGIETSEATTAVDRMLQAVNVFALTANELPLALGIASRGAQALNQSLSETLVAIGLVKNVIPTVERSATAMAVAMERLADPRVQQHLRGIGVAVVTSAGHFRPFLDVLSDAIPALNRMTDAQRSAFLLKSFGQHALGGVLAIMKQVTDGVRTNTGATVRGAEAVKYLRDQFENAGGTAAAFRDKLLDTFEGQKKLLHGSLETLAIVVGEPLARALKPVVTGIVNMVNALLNVIRAIPDPIKNVLAKVAVAVGGVLTLFGGFLAAKAAVALLGAGLSAIGITMAGIASAMLPAIALFGLFALVAAGFAVAFERDIGGVASFFERAWARIQLLFRSLAQLVEQGGFSGAIREELNRAENAGIKRFAINVYQIAYRIERFFSGFGAGFVAAIERARPVFDAFSGSLRELAGAFGATGAASAGALAGMHSDRFAQAGAGIGDTLGMIATIVVRVWAGVNEVVTGLIEGFRSAYTALKPAFEFAADAIGFLAEEIRSLVRDFSGADAAGLENVSIWRMIGAAVGWLAGVLASALAGAIGIVALALRTVGAIIGGVVDVVVGLGTAIGDASGFIWILFTERIPRAFSVARQAIKFFFSPIVDFIEGVVDSVRSALDRMIAFMGRLAAKIPARFRPASLDDVIAAGQAADVRINERAAGMSLDDRFGGHAVAASGSQTVAPAPPNRGPATDPAFPAASQIESQSRISDAEIDALIARGITRSDERPIQTHVSLIVDGETLARVSATANRNTRARSFLPVSEAE